MHVTPALTAPHAPIPQSLSIPASPRQGHQPATAAQPGASTESSARASDWQSAPPPRHRRPDASGRPVWSEGRGPEPAPPFLIRWHPVDGAPRHDQAATPAEALALARDARDATSADVAVYRLWSVLPD
ncbi:hypothetical protein [Nitratidesulfovibrio termitidis]|uniref:hypothetical protein n=1 Tax=Nitratidesulfovibrio termitidis TaxID=42252 RepID=UPI00041DA524|nr:hypothetical protein [Nitratidesulfovibrio termitidis]